MNDDIQLDFRSVALTANQTSFVEVPSAEQLRFYAADGNFSVSINDGRFVPMTRAKRLVLPKGAKVIKLGVRDDSGSSNTVSFYFGNVDVFDDTLNVAGVETVSVSGTIDTIEGITNPVSTNSTPTANSVTLDFANYTTDNNILSGKRWVKVTNVHGSNNVVVTINGIVKTLAPAGIYETPQLERGESLPDVEIDAATADAEVEFLNA